MLRQFVNRFRGAMSNSEIYYIMQDACHMFRVDYFIYALYAQDGEDRPQCYISSNVVEDWDECHAEVLLRLNPSLRQCLDSTMSVVWSSGVNSEFPFCPSEIEKNLDPKFVISDGISLGGNVSCGVKGVVALLVCEGLILEYDVALLSSFLHIAAPYAFETLNATHRPGNRFVSLSKRETECLRWVSVGKTSWETSRILGVSEKTVDFHVSNAVEKLNCRNRAQAVAKAVRYGLCDIEFEYLFDQVHNNMKRLSPSLF